MASQVERVSSSSSDNPFLFLRLPEELRVMIYREAVMNHVSNEGKAPKSGDNSSFSTPHGDEYAVDVSDGTGTHYYQPALSRTCCQIRAETLPLFYSGNTFHFTIKDFNYDWFVNWSKGINPTFAQTIPALIVEVIGAPIRNPWVFVKAKEEVFNANITATYLDERGYCPEFTFICALCEKGRKLGQSWADVKRSRKVQAMMRACIRVHLMLNDCLVRNQRRLCEELLASLFIDINDNDE